MKRLIFRLSSLGDIVLVQSALESPYPGETHWVVAREFSSLLEGHPKIRRVWTFDRRRAPGLRAWFSLLDQLAAEGFTEVLDLHSTLRTRIARAYFAWAVKRAGKTMPRWKTLTKERWRRFGYVLFKRHWPSALRPEHLSTKAARLAGGKGSERAHLAWLSRSVSISAWPVSEHYIGFAPSSAWSGKEWPVEKYFSLLHQLGPSRGRYLPVVFGTNSDSAANALRDGLMDQSIPFVDLVGKQTLPEVAAALARCRVVVGPDTGLLHIAEAIGVPVIAIYGPTTPEFGFGVRGVSSLAVPGPVGCSPCSKDGRLCHRFGDRYGCLRHLEIAPVESRIRKFIGDDVRSFEGVSGK